MSRPSNSDPRVVVALDYPDAQTALELVARLSPALCSLKVGKELFTRAGPRFIEEIRTRGFEVFLDLKFHDIPNTVARACAAAADLGVWMINVHALGGRRMMEAARVEIDKRPEDDRPLLIAVTVLTSMEQQDLEEIGLPGSPLDNVRRLAALAHASGLDGVVCSPREAQPLKQAEGPDFKLITPGVRPAGAESADQRRVLTPVDAMRAGSDYLVIGRPVTQAADPIGVLEAIQSEIGSLT